MAKITLFLAVLLAVPFVASAHGDALTFSQTIDGYVANAEYGDSHVTAEVLGRFSFELFDAERTLPIDFTSLWLRIVRVSDAGETTLFAGPVFNPELGGAGISYVFAEPGHHTLYVRYQNGEEEIVEASIPIEVEDSRTLFERYSKQATAFALGAAVCLLLAIAYLRFTKA